MGLVGSWKQPDPNAGMSPTEGGKVGSKPLGLEYNLVGVWQDRQGVVELKARGHNTPVMTSHWLGAPGEAGMDFRVPQLGSLESLRSCWRSGRHILLAATTGATALKIHLKKI